MKARIKGSSPLHVMEKTALEVELRKSIVSDDALLPRQANELKHTTANILMVLLYLPL